MFRMLSTLTKVALLAYAAAKLLRGRDVEPARVPVRRRR
jgi:hypothetical protein